MSTGRKCAASFVYSAKRNPAPSMACEADGMEHKGLRIGLYRSRAHQCSYKRNSKRNATEMQSTRNHDPIQRLQSPHQAIRSCETWLVTATSAPWEERGWFTMGHSCNAGSFTATLPVGAVCLYCIARESKAPSCSLSTDRSALTVAVFEQPGNRDCGIAAPQCA